MSSVGLDIGTSKIAACTVKNGCFQALSIDNLDKDYPCSIYYKNKVEFGRSAKNKGQKDPKFYFRNIKCLLGRKYSDPYVQYMKTTEQYGIVEGPGDSVLLEVMENNVIIHKTPFELLSLVVLDTIKKIQSKLDDPLEYLSIAFPPSFNDIQKRELKQIIINSGIRHIEIIPETTAACYYYGYKKMASGHSVLIVDCGAGTIDASLVEYCDDELRIISHDGDSTIGGNLYTDKVSSYVYNQLIKAGFDMSQLKQRDHIKIQMECERCKIGLMSNSTVEFNPDIEGIFTITLTQYGLKLLCKDTNAEVKKMIDSLIKQSNVQPTHLILSGKGMNLKCLAEEICGFVNNCVPIMNIEEPVAVGLAMYMYDHKEMHNQTDSCNQLETYTTLLKSKRTPAENVAEKPFPFPIFQKEFVNSMDSNGGSATTFSSNPFPAVSSYSALNTTEIPDCPVVPPPNPYTGNDYVNTFIQSIPVVDVNDMDQKTQDDNDWTNTIYTMDLDNMLDSSKKMHINEKRSMDIRIGTKKDRIHKKDTRVILSRNKRIPCKEEIQLNFGTGELQFELFEGNNQYKKDCRRIRHTLLKRDDDHPSTDIWPFVLCLDVKQDGLFDITYKWLDTGKAIEVISDKEIPIYQFEPLPEVPIHSVESFEQEHEEVCEEE